MTPQNLLLRLQTTKKCTTGCPILDRCLAGGIPCGTITELVAESGSGKTQLCLQFSLSAQLPVSRGGISASSLYLHTEFPFPLRRLHQLATSFRLSNRQLYSEFDDDPCDHVYVQSVHTADQLFDEMRKIEFCVANAKTRFPVRFIVVDSIAALFRSEFDNTPSDLKKRSSLFFKISGKLRELAEKFNLAVLVTNQVVDMIGPNEGVNGLRVGNLRTLYSSERRVCAALGLAWANCVNSRLFLSKNEEIVGEKKGEVAADGLGSFCRRSVRHLHVVFAPHLPASSCEFVITKEGVSGVNQ